MDNEVLFLFTDTENVLRHLKKKKGAWGDVTQIFVAA